MGAVLTKQHDEVAGKPALPYPGGAIRQGPEPSFKGGALTVFVHFLLTSDEGAVIRR